MARGPPVDAPTATTATGSATFAAREAGGEGAPRGGHLQIEEDQVRREPQRLPERLLAVRRGAHHARAARALHGPSHRGPARLRVVHEEDADGTRCRRGARHGPGSAAARDGLRYARSERRWTISKSAVTLRSDSEWPSRSHPPSRSVSWNLRSTRRRAGRSK